MTFYSVTKLPQIVIMAPSATGIDAAIAPAHGGYTNAITASAIVATPLVIPAMRLNVFFFILVSYYGSNNCTNCTSIVSRRNC